jgi:hypothetical protein
MYFTLCKTQPSHPAGKGGSIRRLFQCRESALAERLSASRGSDDCGLPLPAGEGSRVRENRTLKHRVCFAEREERKTLSPSPRPSPAGRGRIIHRFCKGRKSGMAQETHDEIRAFGCCPLSLSERILPIQVRALNHRTVAADVRGRNVLIRNPLRLLTSAATKGRFIRNFHDFRIAQQDLEPQERNADFPTGARADWEVGVTGGSGRKTLSASPQISPARRVGIACGISTHHPARWLRRQPCWSYRASVVESVSDACWRHGTVSGDGTAIAGRQLPMCVSQPGLFAAAALS